MCVFLPEQRGHPAGVHHKAKGVPHKYCTPSFIAEHNRATQLRKDEEEKRARHDLRRRATKKHDIMDRFRRRRLQNFADEVQITGTARARPPPPSRREPRQRRNEPTKKDWAYYKRTGFVWSDLGSIPKSRLALLVRPMTVKRDRECMERLMARVEQEDKEIREQKFRHHERISAYRAHRSEKVSLLQP